MKIYSLRPVLRPMMRGTLFVTALGLSIALLAGPALANKQRASAISVDPVRFLACMRELKQPAKKAGVPHRAYDRLTANARPDPTVLEKLAFQPETVTPIWDYLDILVSPARIRDGRVLLAKHRTLLSAIEKKYGVPPQVLVAIWGVESNFGRNFGQRSLVNSLATLACYGRRQKFFRTELIAALKILHNRDIEPGKFAGSWAGAFGHTQFMPSTFLQRAVDHDGDGRRDLIGSFADALASTANLLRHSGWQTGRPWGLEVSLGNSVKAYSDTRTRRKPLKAWQAAGVRPVNPKDKRLRRLPRATPSAVIRPADVGGPAFIVFKNFDAVYRYNPSIKYALAVNHLADRMVGAKPFIGKWPTKHRPLSRSKRMELQTVLKKRGHKIGTIDGILGPLSKRAIRAEQRRFKLEPTGFASQALLDTLRQKRN